VPFEPFATKAPRIEAAMVCELQLFRPFAHGHEIKVKRTTGLDLMKPMLNVLRPADLDRTVCPSDEIDLGPRSALGKQPPTPVLVDRLAPVSGPQMVRKIVHVLAPFTVFDGPQQSEHKGRMTETARLHREGRRFEPVTAHEVLRYCICAIYTLSRAATITLPLSSVVRKWSASHRKASAHTRCQMTLSACFAEESRSGSYFA
jgi:hypothetical protein